MKKIILVFLIAMLLDNIYAKPPTFNHSLPKKTHLRLGKYLLPANQKVQISDWLHPTINDYRQLQNYLSNAPRPELIYTNYPGTTFRSQRIRNFRLIDDGENPEFKILYLNGDPSNKTNCIVTYISYNGTYKKGLSTLIKCLETVGFNGHVIYRIGGWPDVEEGSLELFDVPYVFKIFSIMEAKRLGYKNCMWLDVSYKILKPLDEIFDHIDHFGVYFQCSSDYSNKSHIQEFATNALGFSLSEFLKLPAVSASVVGVGLHHLVGESFLNSWFEMARGRIGFLSFIPEQAPLCALAERLQLWSFAGNKKHYVSSSKEISSDTVLFLDRSSIE
jgi:hypothetical protein